MPLGCAAGKPARVPHLGKLGRMNKPREYTMAARLAMACLAILGSVGGWLIVVGYGFHHKPYRSSPDTVFVNGPEAFVMAAIMFILSAVSVAALLQAWNAPRWSYPFACGAVLIIPAIYVLAR